MCVCTPPCRRGVALNAAAGVTEDEWAAAVRLGQAGAAAKAFLFDKKHSNLSMAVAATAPAAAATLRDDAAAASCGTAGRVEAAAMQQPADARKMHERQQQQVGEDTDSDVVIEDAAGADVMAVDEPPAAPAAASTQQPQLQQQGQGVPPTAAPGSAPSGPRQSHKLDQAAREAMAAVEAAGTNLQARAGRGLNRHQRRR